MACANYHTTTSKVQGPGACCAGLAASGMPAQVGTRFAVTIQTKSGPQCRVCEIKASTSKKHPGALVFKRGKSLGLCPTVSEGCCQLAAA